MSHSEFDVLPQFQVFRAVSAALTEDLGDAGDITSRATIAEDASAAAAIVTREPGRIAGLQLVEAAFKSLDHDIDFAVLVPDGADADSDAVVAKLSGRARAILGAERVALNYLCHLSGIATLTRDYVNAIEGTGARISCTRKTTPGLRAFEKYAVRAGGGMNHRFGLYDAILIKDNHVAAAGGVGNAIAAARAHAGHMVSIEVEVDTLEQLDAALEHPIDAALLDNMNTEQLSEAVRRARGKVILEASGGVNLQTVREIAQTGVDVISSGALTHSAAALDLSLDFLPS